MLPTLIAQIKPAVTAPGVTETMAKVPLDLGSAFATFEMQILAILLAVDIILGVAAALAEKKFLFSMLANFMSNGVIPFLLGFAVVQLVAQELPFYGQIATQVVFVVIAVNIIASIIANLATLGVSMPTVLKKKIEA